MSNRRGGGVTVLGPVTRVDFPGSATGTVVLDLNDTGTAVGMYDHPIAAS